MLVRLHIPLTPPRQASMSHQVSLLAQALEKRAMGSLIADQDVFKVLGLPPQQVAEVQVELHESAGGVDMALDQDSVGSHPAVEALWTVLNEIGLAEGTELHMAWALSPDDVAQLAAEQEQRRQELQGHLQTNTSGALVLLAETEPGGAFDPVVHEASGKAVAMGVQVAAWQDPVHAQTTRLCTLGCAHGYEEALDNLDVDEAPPLRAYELTAMIPSAANASEPPEWALNLMARIADLVSAGEILAPGHSVEIDDAGPGMAAVLFAQDPDVPVLKRDPLDTGFLRMVSVTHDEYALVQDWDCQAFVDELATHTPLLLDRDRPSILKDDAVRERLKQRAEYEGSSTQAAFVGDLQVLADDDTSAHCHVEMPQHALADLHRLLRTRLAFDREFVLVGHDSGLRITPGASRSWSFDDELLTISWPAAEHGQLRDAFSHHGRVAIGSLLGLTFNIVPEN